MTPTPDIEFGLDSFVPITVDESGRELSGDVVIVTPLLDRLMHHGHLLKFVGKSWRLKESAERLAKARQTA